MPDTSVLLRDARHRAGLTQRELAERAGTSQPALAAYESGRARPRVDTLDRLLRAAGFELDIRARPVVRRGATPLSGLAQALSGLLAAPGGEGDGWRLLLQFVDDFRGSPVAGQRWLVEEAPEPTGDPRFDAALAAVADFLCDEASLARPPWTDGPERYCEPWWFVAGLPGFEAMALRDSPTSFARHGVFVNEGALDRV